MSLHHQKLGRWGESVAMTYLQANNFEIKYQNWRCPRGEIDIIAWQADTWHFIEVKTRRGRNKGTPEESITPRKANQMITTALLFLAAHDLDDIAWQIDLVAVELDSAGKLLRCELIPNFIQGA